MPFFSPLRGMCFFFLPEPRIPVNILPLSPLGILGHTGPASLPSLLCPERPGRNSFVAFWSQSQGCLRWIKNSPLIVFTFQEVKCFSNQKQRYLTQVGQAHMFVKEETMKFPHCSLSDISHWASSTYQRFKPSLLEMSWPGPALFYIQRVTEDERQARQRDPTVKNKTIPILVIV